MLTVDKITLALAQPINSTGTFSITSNVAWVTTFDPATASSWLTVNPNAGTGDSLVTIAKATSANTTTAPRFASIVVTGNGVPPQTLIATQAAPASNGLAPTGATLPNGATLTFTPTDPDAPDEPPFTVTYTIAANNKLTTTDFNPPATDTFAYEYTANGNYGTLVMPELDSVCSLQFTTATAGAITLYGFDNNGPYEETGAFTYTAPTYALTITTAAGATTTATAAGATVNITANPAPSGQAFDHWTSSPSVTFANANNATTTFTMSANATTITAIYKDQTTGGGGNTGGNNTGGGSSGSGGGGGGGAPSLLYLAAFAALAALRGAKQK